MNRSTEGSGRGFVRHFLFLLALASCAFAIAAGPASADEIPAGTTGSVSAVSYTSAHLTGTVDPFERLTYYGFEYSTDQVNWTRGPQAYYAGNPTVAANSGPTAVSEDLTELKGGTEYFVRIGTYDEVEFTEHFSAAPYLSFTTVAVASPTVTIDPVTAITGTSAHFSGSINPNAPVGNPDAFKVDYSFQCIPACGGLSVGHLAADSSSHVVEGTATGLEPNTSYEVKLVATNAGGSESAGPQGFQTDAVSPGVETLAAFAIEGGTEALLGGRVNPKNSATVYWVEYGTDTGYGQSFPAAEDADAGSGHEAQILSEKVTGLTPATEYHFRLVAENAVGETQGQDMNFETAPAGPATESCDNATLRSENSSTELPDCRAYEQVSPVDKNGYDAGTQSVLPGYVAAADGSALSFESYGAFADPVGGSAINSYLSRRGSGGWTTQALSPPVSAENISAGFPEFSYFTPDLKYAVVHTPANLLLAPDATPNAVNYYLRDNSTGIYRTLSHGTGPGPGPETEFSVAAMSVDGEHVLFESSAALTDDAPPGVYNLYEWSDGQLKLVTIGLDGTPVPTGGWIEARGFTSITTHAMSEDGSRAVFKSFEGEALGQLFLYEEGQSTVEISASHRSTADPGGPGEVRFLGASADMSQIYFSDSEALTDDATPGYRALYRYDADTETLINVEASLGASAELTEGIGAISEDGSYVYFRTNSKLYLWHNGINTLVGDVPGNQAELEAYYTTYRVTGDGRYLTFQTPARLTAYDNTGESEVYLYDATLQRLTCVSCNPDGLTPNGSSNFPGPPRRPERNLQPGASVDGAVIFNSSDALVPNDVNGKEDVYEWKQGRVSLISSGTSGDPSYYASASKSGDDVFFATREPLVASDRDQLLDVYDAHVGGGFPRAAQSTPCEGAETCHGSASSAPGFADPATGALSGASALSPSARRLKAALKACKHKPKKARAKCRSNARKRFTKAGRAH